MARRVTSESRQARERTESQEEMGEEKGRGTMSTNPSSWWEERKKIERPRMEDQERRYREEQEKYEQERQRATYYKPIELERPRAEEQERYYREEQERSVPGGAGAKRAKPGEAEPRRQMGVEEAGERKDIFQIWTDNYNVISRMWEDSYTNLYKPWIESTGEIYNKAAELSKNPTPENYRAFFDEWFRTYQNTFGKLYPVMTRQPVDREIIQKLMDSAEESRGLFQSWIETLNENSRRTQELLQGTPDPEKFREFYDMWIRTYGKIFREFAEMPAKGRAREVLETYGGMPNIYVRSFAQAAKLWNDSYLNLIRPWVDSMLSLSGKMAELSRGEARPEAYKEFYNQWMDTYRETYGRMFNIQSASSASKAMAESFMRNADIYMDMYKSWVSAVENISQRTMDISTGTAKPEAYKEFYNTWTDMYEKTFDNLFRYSPAISPMKNMMEPVKNAARTYTDMLANISDMWMRAAPGSTSKA